MKIRSKIIIITIPLIIAPLFFSLLISTLSTRNGITRVATEFLTFKSDVFNNYLDSQWNLLIKNQLNDNPEFLAVSQAGAEDYSQTLISNSSERIFAVSGEGKLAIQSGGEGFSEGDLAILSTFLNRDKEGWQTIPLESGDLIASITYFEPFDWYVFLSMQKEAFYGIISTIIYRTLVIFIISLIMAVLLLFLFSSLLTRPLETVVDAIKTIITTNDLSIKVDLQYQDETGKLGHYFNIMTGELDKAYNQMKKYALQAVVAKHKESKIRNIFQKYVPKDVIDKFYSDPESMLVGDNRVLAVLFSDIRSFTTISESMAPDEIVDSLNKYFEIMVDSITSRSGIVDKYIGDAIMAFFGAPVHTPNDAVNALNAGLDMLENLKEFNTWQTGHGRKPFEIGIGINYGVVTIGNIGSEKKMDYTVIGDMVNLASRLEGLTKLYKEPILISESMYQKVHDQIPCRMVDKVIVKGKTQSVRVYSAARNLSHEMEEAWESHEEGVEAYYNREFSKALGYFDFCQKLLPGDHCSRLFYQRCQDYIVNPPPADWKGSTVLNRK